MLICGFQISPEDHEIQFVNTLFAQTCLICTAQLRPILYSVGLAQRFEI